MRFQHRDEHRNRYSHCEQTLGDKDEPGLPTPLRLLPQTYAERALISLQLVEWLRYACTDRDIRIFMNDCSDNNLPECKTPEETPLLLLFNRILIRYSGDPTNLECKRAKI